MRKALRWILLAALLLLIIGAAGFVVWASTTPDSEAPALAALESDAAVTVTRGDWLIFTPAGAEPTAGYIFYPGGRVAPDSYAAYARAVAEAGYLVVIVPMPLNLAVFDSGAAARVMDAYPAVEHWAVGGHSLGGSMAARFAHDHLDRVDGLVLIASYPEASKDLSGAALATASIYGTLDGLATVETVESSRPLLPSDTLFVAIEGGNHAQFGWYGAQAGDNPATISAEDQHAQTVAATLRILEALGTDS